MLWPWLCCNIDFYSQYSPPLVSLSRDVETTHGLSREPPKTPFHLQLPLAPLVHWSTLVHTGPLVPPGTQILFSAASCATWSIFVSSQHSHFGEVQSWEQTEAFQKVNVNFQPGKYSPVPLNVMSFLYSFHIAMHCGPSCKHFPLWKNALQRLARHVGFRWNSAFLIYVHLSRWEMAMHLSSPHIQLDRAAINTHCLNIWSRFYVCSSSNKK